MKNPVVLCVDDEPNVLEALYRELRKDGYNILLAGSAEEALEVMKSNRVDVIVSDELMPGMGGNSLLQWIKEDYPGTTRIMLTGHYNESEVTLGAINRAEVFRLLPKPWGEDELRDAVREAVTTGSAR